MSNQQRNVLRIGLAIVALACVFPAWNYHWDVQGVVVDHPAGFSFLASPPTPPSQPNVWSVRVDTSRTAMVVFAVICLTGLTTLSLRRGINSI